VLNRRLTAHRADFLAGDYLREAELPDGTQQELWRISARVSATKEVDYALFKRDLQSKIDPILADLEAEGVKGVSVDYTGLVPLVYKAQHSLLDGLMTGFIYDFAIIVVVMIVLCRAASAGLVLLLPAAFPALMVFGGVGWTHAMLKSFDAGTLLIDIGTVMAPSVALGVTVDDVVHFMLWFRRGISEGMNRKDATMLAYKGCARAMYQSWGVIGIGLSVFSLSPFGSVGVNYWKPDGFDADGWLRYGVGVAFRLTNGIVLAPSLDFTSVEDSKELLGLRISIPLGGM
jgi:predicted RND superfamily exporter protein